MKEVWKPIPGHEGYFASSMGRIRSARVSVLRICGRNSKPTWQKSRDKILRPGTTIGKGYLFFVSSIHGQKKYVKVHRAVLAAFTGDFKSQPVNHINGIKTDNRPENLEWCTQKQNVKHAMVSGLFKDRLSIADVRAIRFFFKRESRRESNSLILSKIFDCKRSTITEIIAGRIYSNYEI